MDLMPSSLHDKGAQDGMARVAGATDVAIGVAYDGNQSDG